jgi:hypothetical protein
VLAFGCAHLTSALTGAKRLGKGEDGASAISLLESQHKLSRSRRAVGKEKWLETIIVIEYITNLL